MGPPPHKFKTKSLMQKYLKSNMGPLPHKSLESRKTKRTHPTRKTPSRTACNNTQGCFAHGSTCASGLRPDGFLAKPGNSQGILTSLRCSCSLRAAGVRSGGLRPTALSSSRNRLIQKPTSPCVNVTRNAANFCWLSSKELDSQIQELLFLVGWEKPKPFSKLILKQIQNSGKANSKNLKVLF
jgi:hypothetical protein